MQSQESESYKLTLEGQGISINRDVGQDVARAILDVVLGGTMRTLRDRAAPEQDEVPGSRGRPEMSLHEFLEQSGAKRNPDKIAAIGWYIIKHEEQTGFSREEVKGRFRDAGEAVPGNFPRDFSWALKNGWIAEDPRARGLFYIPKKGVEAIEAKFSPDIRKRTAQKKSVSRRKAKKGEDALNGSGEDE